jgi:hypothetical protein
VAVSLCGSEILTALGLLYVWVFVLVLIGEQNLRALTTPPLSARHNPGKADESRSPALPCAAQHTLDRLAAACGLPSPEGLYAAHAAELLEALAAEEPGWEAHSAGRYLLESLLRGCTAPVLEANLGRLLPMVANCVKLERCEECPLPHHGFSREYPSKGVDARWAVQSWWFHCAAARGSTCLSLSSMRLRLGAQPNVGLNGGCG